MYIHTIACSYIICLPQIRVKLHLMSTKTHPAANKYIWRTGATNTIFFNLRGELGNAIIYYVLYGSLTTKSELFVEDVTVVVLELPSHTSTVSFIFATCNSFDLMERGSRPPQEHTLVGHSLTEGLLSLACLCQRSSASWGSLAVLQDSGSWVTCRGNCNLPLYCTLCYYLSLIIPCLCCIAYRKWNWSLSHPAPNLLFRLWSIYVSFKLLSPQDTVQLNSSNCARQSQPLVIVMAWEAGLRSKRVCLRHNGGNRPRGWHELSLEAVASRMVGWRLGPRSTQVERIQLAWPKLWPKLKSGKKSAGLGYRL